MGKKSRRAATTVAERPQLTDVDVPVVGGREPCPCGSGKRYKACHGLRARHEAVRLVGRPFEGLTGECDWVAMREIVPAASAVVRVSEELGGGEVTVATVLPMAWPALHRSDGAVFVGLQTAGGSGDPSRDVAAALLRAREAEPGTPIPDGPLPGVGPRLQDVLAPDLSFDVTVHDGFDFWLQGVEDLTADARESMERANATVVPTVRLAAAPAAYWCRMGDRRHLRWVVSQPEDAVLDAIARLHAAGESGMGPGSRYVGSFRAHGLLVPVWDLAPDAEADDVEEPLTAFVTRFEQALVQTEPLTVAERRARAGALSRQLTLR